MTIKIYGVLHVFRAAIHLFVARSGRWQNYRFSAKNWCQIGVNLRKMSITRVKNACQPWILLGLQKNIKKISTRLLTLLTTSVIVPIEQKNLVSILKEAYVYEYQQIYTEFYGCGSEL